MALDIAMGGSTNTILHLLAAAHEARVDFGLKEIDELSRRVPCLCKVAPSSTLPRGGRAPGRRHPGHPGRAGPGWPAQPRRAHRAQPLAAGSSWTAGTSASDVGAPADAVELFHAAPGGVRTIKPYSQSHAGTTLDDDRAGGCIRDAAARLHRRRRPGRAVREPGAGRARS